MAVAAYAVLISLLISCTASTPSPREPRASATLTIGMPEVSGRPTDRDTSVLADMFSAEGLVSLNDDGRPAPRLAERWTTSPDGLTWQFTIRKGVHFSDGTPADARSIRDTLESALGRPAERMLRPGIADVTSVVALDPRTLEIRVGARSAFLLEDMDIELTRTAPGALPAGTGPFQIVGREQQNIVLDANADYYLGRPTIDHVVIQSFPTLRMAWASLMRGEVDALSYVAQDAVEFIARNEIQTYSYRRNYQYLIAFNSARVPFRDPPVRRALNAAIDRETLIRTVLKGAGQPANGPLWPYHWAYDPSIPKYGYDPSMAVTALEAAGLRMHRSATAPVPARLRFTCIVPQEYSVHERLALNVQKQLYDIGVDMELMSLAPGEYDRRLRASDFDAAFVDLVSGPSLARAYGFWRSAEGFQGLNVFGYHNAEADQWFDALRHAPDDGAFRAAASQLQRTLLQDPPALFLAWNERARAVSRRFEVPVDPGGDPFRQLRLWRPRGDRQ